MFLVIILLLVSDFITLRSENTVFVLFPKNLLGLPSVLSLSVSFYFKNVSCRHTETQCFCLFVCFCPFWPTASAMVKRLGSESHTWVILPGLWGRAAVSEMLLQVLWGYQVNSQTLLNLGWGRGVWPWPCFCRIQRAVCSKRMKPSHLLKKKSIKSCPAWNRWKKGNPSPGDTPWNGRGILHAWVSPGRADRWAGCP